MNIERIIDGLIRYIDRTMVPNMNGLQEAGYLVLGELVRSNPEVVTAFIYKNIFLRTFLVTDKSGNIDIDRLYTAIDRVMQKKGSVRFEIPLYGPITLDASDIRNIYNTIKE